VKQKLTYYVGQVIRGSSGLKHLLVLGGSLNGTKQEADL